EARPLGRASTAKNPSAGPPNGRASDKLLYELLITSYPIFTNAGLCLRGERTAQVEGRPLSGRRTCHYRGHKFLIAVSGSDQFHYSGPGISAGRAFRRDTLAKRTCPRGIGAGDALFQFFLSSALP